MELNIVRDTIKELTDIDIFQQTRKREVIELRSVANTYLYDVCRKTLGRIVKEYARNGFKTTHPSIIHSINTYNEHKQYNKELEAIYLNLIGSNKLKVLRQIPKATEEQIEQIEQILL